MLERADLQRLLRANIQVIADDVLVVSEEFGAFADARRRIDLLGVDHHGRLVVFELKRTTDGGRVELQALRYAAMVFAMTFDELVEPAAVDEARDRLAAWLDDAGGEEAILSREVRIVLVAAGFDIEITTTVLWPTDVYGLDISCVRLSPYKVDDRLLLDVQQVIPLPEASELTVRLRRREGQVRAVREDNRDWTPYVITTPAGRSEPLRKRRAILAMVTGLHAPGVPAERMAAVLGKKLLSVDGQLSGPNLDDAFAIAYPAARNNLGKWFLDSPIHEAGRTRIVSKMWGRTLDQPTGFAAGRARMAGTDSRTARAQLRKGCRMDVQIDQPTFSMDRAAYGMRLDIADLKCICFSVGDDGRRGDRATARHTPAVRPAPGWRIATTGVIPERRSGALNPRTLDGL